MSHGREATGEGDTEGEPAGLAEAAGDVPAAVLVLPQAVSSNTKTSVTLARMRGTISRWRVS